MVINSFHAPHPQRGRDGNIVRLRFSLIVNKTKHIMPKKTDIANKPVVVSSITIQSAQQRIFTVRGQQVMLDRDLAQLYGVETKVLNQAVKRNMGRFPSEFMFQPNYQELANLKSQFVTASWGGDRRTPYLFTEQGYRSFERQTATKTKTAEAHRLRSH